MKLYYEEQGISAADFRCKHLKCCKLTCTNFTEAREAYIGREYEKRTVPRLLFLSLDPGQGDDGPEARTLAACRDWEERKCDVEELNKNRHWYLTHNLAFELLRPIKKDLSLKQVHHYFAHTNSAKCCMNNPGNSSAAPRMFDACREYIPGELLALQPEILVTQGDMAKVAVESSFSRKASKGDLKGCGHAILDLNGREA